MALPALHRFVGRFVEVDERVVEQAVGAGLQTTGRAAHAAAAGVAAWRRRRLGVVLRRATEPDRAAVLAAAVAALVAPGVPGGFGAFGQQHVGLAPGGGVAVVAGTDVEVLVVDRQARHRQRAQRHVQFDGPVVDAGLRAVDPGLVEQLLGLVLGAVVRALHVHAVDHAAFALDHQHIGLGKGLDVAAVVGVGVSRQVAVVEPLVAGGQLGRADLGLGLGDVDGFVELSLVAAAAARPLTEVGLQVVRQRQASHFPARAGHRQRALEVETLVVVAVDVAHLTDGERVEHAPVAGADEHLVQPLVAGGQQHVGPAQLDEVATRRRQLVVAAEAAEVRPVRRRTAALQTNTGFHLLGDGRLDAQFELGPLAVVGAAGGVAAARSAGVAGAHAALIAVEEFHVDVRAAEVDAGSECGSRERQADRRTDRLDGEFLHGVYSLFVVECHFLIIFSVAILVALPSGAHV